LDEKSLKKGYLMGKNLESLPIDENGNGERLRTLTFDIADAAMLYHAAMIATTTVGMGGGGKAEERMRYYKSKFLEACPAGHKHFKREEDIANIAIVMMDADQCTIQRIKEYSRSPKQSFEIKIGNKKWDNWNLTEEDVGEVIACLKEIAPLTCEITELETKVESKW